MREVTSDEGVARTKEARARRMALYFIVKMDEWKVKMDDWKVKMDDWKLKMDEWKVKIYEWKRLCMGLRRNWSKGGKLVKGRQNKKIDTT